MVKKDAFAAVLAEMRRCGSSARSRSLYIGACGRVVCEKWEVQQDKFVRAFVAARLHCCALLSSATTTVWNTSTNQYQLQRVGCDSASHLDSEPGRDRLLRLHAWPVGQTFVT